MSTLGNSPRTTRNLSLEEACRAFASILSGSEGDILVATFLTTLRWKGVTEEELAGFAMAARAKADIPCVGVPDLLCVSATLDGQVNFPPLDAAAGMIAAGAGQKVLLLSDTGTPPRRGLTAAHILNELGASMTWDPREAEAWIESVGFTVLSVSGVLPALVPLRRVRGGMVLRSPLATVEKLLAPSSASVLLGAQHGPVLGAAIEVVKRLQHPSGVVLQGEGGGVIPYVRRRTKGIELTEGFLARLTVEPGDFGLQCTHEPELPMYGPPADGEGPEDNASLVRAAGLETQSVLAGERTPSRNAALLGAGLMLKATAKAMTLADGVSMATESLDSGAASAVLARLREVSSI
ncbi:MAG: anthranilate phosphoribosyltransferase [Planctomycetota bacterium]|jgi:anthranilate phosphoribosyltransferase